MAGEVKRVQLGPETDMVQVLEEVHADGIPRLIERNGEALAVVVSAEEFATADRVPKSRRFKKDLLALAGVWSDLDGEQMIEEIYRARYEAPPSPPVEI